MRLLEHESSSTGLIFNRILLSKKWNSTLCQLLVPAQAASPSLDRKSSLNQEIHKNELKEPIFNCRGTLKAVHRKQDLDSRRQKRVIHPFEKSWDHPRDRKSYKRTSYNFIERSSLAYVFRRMNLHTTRCKWNSRP